MRLDVFLFCVVVVVFGGVLSTESCNSVSFVGVGLFFPHDPGRVVVMFGIFFPFASPATLPPTAAAAADPPLWLCSLAAVAIPTAVAFAVAEPQR